MWQNVKLVSSGDELMDVHYCVLYFLVCMKLHDRKLKKGGSKGVPGWLSRLWLRS